MVLTCLGILIIGGGILAAMVFFGLNGARDKAKDARIKSDVSSLRASAEMYYDEHQNYTGFTVPMETQNSIRESGSEIIVQGLSESTYVIFAIQPASMKYYCVDASGYSAEVSSVSPSQTSCQ